MVNFLNVEVVGLFLDSKLDGEKVSEKNIWEDN